MIVEDILYIISFVWFLWRLGVCYYNLGKNMSELSIILMNIEQNIIEGDEDKAVTIYSDLIINNKIGTYFSAVMCCICFLHFILK